MNKMQGAEAVLHGERIAGIDAVVKERVAKGYRNRVLDTRLRKARTRSEVRLLHRVKGAGVPCPYVLEVGEFHFAMGKIPGDILARGGMNSARAREAGKLLAKMHSANIVHGDYTPANLMSRRGSAITVIDFGLGSFSNDEEGKAIDIVTMRKAIGEKLAKEFVAGYLKGKGERGIVAHAEKVEARARYMARRGRSNPAAEPYT